MTDEELIEAYNFAQEIDLDHDFILLLEEEMRKRCLLRTWNENIN